MQIVSRRVNEGVVIGEDYTVTILDIGEDWVDIEVSSSGDGDTRVVTLQLPCSKEGALGSEEEIEDLFTVSAST